MIFPPKSHSFVVLQNPGMGFVLIFAVIGIVWMNVPSEKGWVERKRLRDLAIANAAKEAAAEEQKATKSPRGRSRSRRRKTAE